MRSTYLAFFSEYGLTIEEKLAIGTGICSPLMRKIQADLQRNIEEPEENVNRLNPRYSSGVSSPGRHVRTRLYFTSESHVHSLLTVLRHGGLLSANDQQWRRAMEYVSMVSELNYMSQIVVMLYEDPTKDISSDQRFHVELHFSPGVNCCVQKNLPPGPGFRPNTQSKNASGDDDHSVTSIEERDELCGMDEKKTKLSRISNPIRIEHHTVSGHEAMNLAKRLSEELATQNGNGGSESDALNNLPTRAMSPECEPISRSFEGKKGDFLWLYLLNNVNFNAQCVTK